MGIKYNPVTGKLLRTPTPKLVNDCPTEPDCPDCNTVVPTICITWSNVAPPCLCAATAFNIDGVPCNIAETYTFKWVPTVALNKAYQLSRVAFSAGPPQVCYYCYVSPIGDVEFWRTPCDNTADCNDPVFHSDAYIVCTAEILPAGFELGLYFVTDALDGDTRLAAGIGYAGGSFCPFGSSGTTPFFANCPWSLAVGDNPGSHLREVVNTGNCLVPDFDLWELNMFITSGTEPTWAVEAGTCP